MFSLLIDKLPFFTAIVITPTFYILADIHPPVLPNRYDNTPENKSQQQISTLLKRVLIIPLKILKFYKSIQCSSVIPPY